MTSQLSIVASNPKPKRETEYPNYWLIHSSDRDPIEVYLYHDTESQPRVWINKAR